MEKSLRKHALIYLSTLLLVLLTDLYTKHLAESHLRDKDIRLLPFLHLVLVYNKGVAFGLFANAPDFIRVPLLILTPLLALVFTFIYSMRVKDATNSMLMGMVAGGALGNLYDRLFLGQVRDFIYLSYGNLSWPAFNMADASISIAIFILLLRGFFQKG